jgi:mRNA-degrading endonuclease toxin of MazEF toxin-antitoxin module
MVDLQYTTDTSQEALEVQLDCLRRMSPQERVQRSCALSRQVRNMAFDAIRRRHSEWSDEEVQLCFIELNYGRTLADHVRRWRGEQST